MTSTLHPDPMTDLDSHYPVTPQQVRQFREEGFIKLKNVLSAETIDHISPIITDKTFELNPLKDVPLEQKDLYNRAFIQVSNLWEADERIKRFSFSRRIARIASELLGTRGVRMWHDQALYKEPAGGFTPWHVDQQYWPMDSGMSVTAWIPLQATPIEMGPLCFGKGSHLKNIGRDLEIGEESERVIRDAIKQHGVIESFEPYDLGEVSFHYGWTLHRAGPNTTHEPRKVHTVIYMDIDMKLATPKNKNQENDWLKWTPSTKVGQVMDDPRNPVLYESV